MSPSLKLSNIDGLSEEDSSRLQDLFDGCVERESAALKAAINGGLNNIPRLLRVPVKSVLFR